MSASYMPPEINTDLTRLHYNYRHYCTVLSTAILKEIRQSLNIHMKTRQITDSALYCQ